MEQLGEKTSQDVKNTLKQVEPKFKEMQKAYVEEIEKVYKELANDKVLKEISEGLWVTDLSFTNVTLWLVELKVLRSKSRDFR